MIIKVVQGSAFVILVLIALQAPAKGMPPASGQEKADSGIGAKAGVQAGHKDRAAGDMLMIASAITGSSTGTKQKQVKPATSKKTSQKAPSRRGQALIDRNKAAKERTIRESTHSVTSGTVAR
jgi:hypothetical protein